MKRLVKANKLGELIYEYKNGTKEYVIKNVIVPKMKIICYVQWIA